MKEVLSRRQFISGFSAAAGTLGLSPALTFGAEKQSAVAPVAPATPVVNSHLLDSSWPVFTPDLYPEKFQMSGVAVAKDGNVVVLSHGENHGDPQKGFQRKFIKRPAVFVVDPKSGRILRTWGANLFFQPHQISVDVAGNFWVADSGLKRVFKFNPDGVKMLELGTKDTPLEMPTDVAVLSDGSFIVADGAISRRGVRFDSDGHRLGDWGARGEETVQLHTPHSMAVDDEDRVYVADMSNHWVQVLSAEGELIATWSKVGRPLCVRYHAGSIYVLSNLSAAKGIVRRFNKKGELQDSFATRPAETTEDFEWPHGLAIGDGGKSVYVGFVLTARRVQRYKRVIN